MCSVSVDDVAAAAMCDKVSASDADTESLSCHSFSYFALVIVCVMFVSVRYFIRISDYVCLLRPI